MIPLDKTWDYEKSVQRVSEKACELKDVSLTPQERGSQ